MMGKSLGYAYPQRFDKGGEVKMTDVSGGKNESLGNDMVLLEFADGSKRMTQKALYEAADSLGAFDNMTSGDDFADWHLNTWAGGVVSDPQYKAAHDQFNTNQIAYNTALMEANPEIAQNRLAFVQQYAPNNQAAIDAAQSLVDQYSGATGVNYTPSSMTSMTNVDMTAPATDGGIASLVPEAPETDPNASNQIYGANPSDFVVGGLSSFYRPPNEQYTAPTTFGGPITAGQVFAQDRSYGNPFQRPMNFSKGGEVPSWVDPDYGYTEGRKPNMREMMEHLSGKSVEELYADPNSNWQQYSKAATEILYGSVGSNTDTRDFNKIMSAGSAGDTQAIKQAAGAATREMYNNQNRTEKELAKIQMDYAKNGISVNPITQNIAQVISFDPATQNYGTSLYMTDNQGILLRQINQNSDPSLFGINQDEIDTARQQMVSTASLADYYNPPDQSALETILGTTGTDLPAEQATSLTSLDGNTTGSGSLMKQIVTAARDGIPAGSRESYSVGMVGDLTPSYTPPSQANVATMFGGQPMPSETLMATSYTNPFRRPT